MFEKVVTYAKEHKDTLIRQGAIVAGTLIGLAVAGVFVASMNQSLDDEQNAFLGAEGQLDSDESVQDSEE